MIRKIDEANIAEAISFVARLNQNLVHKISYFGDSRKEIEADFSAVQPPEGYAYEATRADGNLVGFFGVEMDPGLGRGWLFGPLVDHPDWEVIADQLYAAITGALPPEIVDQEIFCHTQNIRVQDFALKHGFTFRSEGAVMNLEIAGRENSNPLELCELVKKDFSQFQALHADLFPNTYYSAEQLVALSRDNDKCLLVHSDHGKLVGYIFIQARPAARDGYIDFVGVKPGHRRQGIARGLVEQAVSWAVQKPFVERISLTVSTGNEAAVNLYQSMGFVVETISRSYRKQA
jgi:ribosomal protein S18 acetylase RimI-like enzyme